MDGAVILAAGRGTRMQRPEPSVDLAPGQARMADAGLKALIPIGGRPFLDHTLSALADTGITRVCVVVGPGSDPVRTHYEAHPPRRVSLGFAVQSEPKGTAHALLQAEPAVAGGPFLMLNCDDYYGTEAPALLAGLAGPGAAGYLREDLLASPTLDAARIASFGILQVDEEMMLTRVIEKPDPETLAAMEPPIWVSKNIWRFDDSIFEACRHLPLSERGELELPQAVQRSVDDGIPYRVVRARGPVPDLSERADIPAMERVLAGRVPDP